MKLSLNPGQSSQRAERAFTLVEIVLSLAIIAIAMIAIIGVIPIGLNVQTDNQEESIISTDAGIWMEALSKGAQGMEYLVRDDSGGNDFYIDEVMIERIVRDLSTGLLVSSNKSYVQNFTSASNLIGVLSRPKYQRSINNLETNWNVYADVRALNGNLADTAADMDFAFKYRMTPELVPLLGVHPDHLVSTNFNPTPQRLLILETNLFELRLNFRWPLIVQAGGSYRGQTNWAKNLSFRTQISGQQILLENKVANELPVGDPLFFMVARQYSYLTNVVKP